MTKYRSPEASASASIPRNVGPIEQTEPQGHEDIVQKQEYERKSRLGRFATNVIARLQLRAYETLTAQRLTGESDLDSTPGKPLQTDNTQNASVSVPVSRIIERTDKERAIVSDPEMQGALNIIENAEYVMDDPSTYAELLQRYAKVASEVDWDDASRSDLTKLFGRLSEVDAANAQTLEGKEAIPYPLALETLAKIIPTQAVGKLHDGSQEGELLIRSVLESTPVSFATVQPLVDVLAKVYGSRRALRSVAPGDDAVLDRLRAPEYRTKFALETLADSPEEPMDPESVVRHDQEMIQQTKEILADLGLPEKTVEKFIMAASSRLLEPSSETNSGYINGRNLAGRLRRIWDCVATVGVEGINELQDKLGIVNIDNYLPEDLLNLGKLMYEHKDYIDELQAGDVAVVLNDAYGDHNGALSASFDMYRRESGRTLMFEISSPSDLYRHMIMLKNRGIKPSTLIMGAHGSPGVTHFGNSFNGGFEIVSDPRLVVGTSHDLSKSRIDRIMSDEFMQDSKGIDDGSEHAGRKRLIINSCSSDVAAANGLLSTAETALRTAGREDVDVYGASADLYSGQDSDGAVSFLGKGANDEIELPIGRKLSLERKERRLRRPKTVVQRTGNIQKIYRNHDKKHDAGKVNA